jgi:4-azaleucine resistance transporter AzlC
VDLAPWRGMEATTAHRADMRTGLRAGAPLAVAVGVFGVSFGVLARAVGFDPAAAIVMSATTFAGSAQFAVVAVLSAGGSTASAVLAAVLLNARYLPMGLAAARAVPGSFVVRLLRAQLVVDESWAIGHLGEGRFAPGRMLGAGLVLYGAWVAGTALGVAGAAAIKDPTDLGLDAAFPALFLALLAGQVHSRRDLLAALAAAAVALATVPLLPPGLPLVAASLVCLAGLGPAVRRRRAAP